MHVGVYIYVWYHWYLQMSTVMVTAIYLRQSTKSPWWCMLTFYMQFHSSNMLYASRHHRGVQARFHTSEPNSTPAATSTSSIFSLCANTNKASTRKHSWSSSFCFLINLSWCSYIYSRSRLPVVTDQKRIHSTIPSVTEAWHDVRHIKTCSQRLAPWQWGSVKIEEALIAITEPPTQRRQGTSNLMESSWFGYRRGSQEA